MQAIGRLEREQPTGTAGTENGLIPGVRSRLRIVILEDRGMSCVDVNFADDAAHHHDIVGLGPIKFVDAKRRLAPVNAIIAFRVGAKQRVHLLIFFGIGLVERADLIRLIVHPVFVPILEHTMVPAPAALPKGIVH